MKIREKFLTEGEHNKRMTPEEVEERLDAILDGDYEAKSNSIVDVLDAALVENRENRRLSRSGKAAQVQNVLILGEPGGGKSGIIDDWAKSRHVKLVSFTGANLDADMGKGVPVEIEVDTGEVDENGNPIKEKRTQRLMPTDWDRLLNATDENGKRMDIVLFLDELNRAWVEAEGAILTLIQDHKINFGGKDYHYPNLLFTVGAINPTNGTVKEEDIRDLGQALSTRFRHVEWVAELNDTANFWLGQLEDYMEQNDQDLADGEVSQKRHDKAEQQIQAKMDIVNAFVDSPDFDFSKQDVIEAKKNTRDKLYISARTLWSAILNCNGTFGELNVAADENPDANDAKPFNCFLQQFIDNCKPTAEELQAAIDAWDAYQQKMGNAPGVAQNNNNATRINNNVYSAYLNWKQKYEAANGAIGV